MKHEHPFVRATAIAMCAYTWGLLAGGCGPSTVDLGNDNATVDGLRKKKDAGADSASDGAPTPLFGVSMNGLQYALSGTGPWTDVAPESSVVLPAGYTGSVWFKTTITNVGNQPLGGSATAPARVFVGSGFAIQDSSGGWSYWGTFGSATGIAPDFQPGQQMVGGDNTPAPTTGPGTYKLSICFGVVDNTGSTTLSAPSPLPLLPPGGTGTTGTECASIYAQYH